MTTQRRRAPTTRRISDQWLQYIRGTVQESGINTFTQVSVALPVVVAEGFVIEAHLVEFMLPPVVPADFIATDDQIQMAVQLTKASQASLVTLSDPDYIYGHLVDAHTVDVQTAEKAPVWDNHRLGALNWQFPEPILLPFSEIFFGARSQGFSSVGNYHFRIGYKTVRLTTRQLPELIQAVT